MKTRTPITIRQAAAADAGAMASLLNELGYPCNAAQVVARLDCMAGSARDVVMVAEDEGRVVGLAALHVMPCLHDHDPMGRLTALVVAASHRRTGLGRALLEEAEHRAGSLGCARMEVTSSDHRIEAHRFYESMNYARRPERFVKRLAPPKLAQPAPP